MECDVGQSMIDSQGTEDKSTTALQPYTVGHATSKLIRQSSLRSAWIGWTSAGIERLPDRRKLALSQLGVAPASVAVTPVPGFEESLVRPPACPSGDSRQLVHGSAYQVMPEAWTVSLDPRDAAAPAPPAVL